MTGVRSRSRLPSLEAWGRKGLRIGAREPLVAFIAVGLLLFAGSAIVGPRVDDAAGRHEIVVDHQALVRFVESRTQNYDDASVRSYVGSLSRPELARLVADFVREEVLYREAVALGLDRSDYVIRRRLVQSLEFAMGASGARTVPLGEAELRRFYSSHRERYATPPSISFTHVFFSAELHGWAEARRLADTALIRLRARRAVPTATGDRFRYFVNYVNHNPPLIESHFGQEMTTSLFKLKADPETWTDPIRSALGFHLVQVIDRTEGGVPRFEQVRSLVANDAEGAATQAESEQNVDKLLALYTVRMAGGLPPAASAK